MTLWALRRAILGPGPWLMITSETNLGRLMNSPRRRQQVKTDVGDWPKKGFFF
jgi:hypothetical protein